MKSKRRKPIRSRLEKPVVAVERFSVGEAMVEQASAYGWRLLDLELTGGWVPANPPPIGAIITHPAPAPVATQLLKLGCPMVRSGYAPHFDDDKIPAVLNDTAAYGTMAADHFSERDFHHVGYVALAPFKDQNLRAPYNAFHDRAIEKGMTCDLLKVRLHGRDNAEGFSNLAKQVADWLKTVPKPIGLMARGNLAAKVCYVCRARGIAVPEEVAILRIGNDVVTCESTPVSMSAIDTNDNVKASTLLQVLNELIQGNAPERATFIPPSGVIVRRSTDVLAVRDPIVAKAIRFMWDHHDLPLTIEDVAYETGTTRRTLERLFHKHLGRAPFAELRRKRLEKACELLLSTNISIAEIASQIGIGTKLSLHRAFKDNYGVPPGEFRRARGKLNKVQ